MNRRRFLVALAVILPLAMFGAARWATRLRPVKIGALTGRHRTGYPDVAVHVGRTVLVAGGGYADWNRFDLNAKTRGLVTDESLVEGTDTRVQIRTDARGRAQLVWRDGTAAPVAYAMGARPGERSAKPSIFVENSRNPPASLLARRNLRVSPDLSRVEVVWNQTYYRWNRATRALERRTVFRLDGMDAFGEKWWALTRDGETLIVPAYEGIARYSTRTGKRTARVRLPEFTGFQGEGGGIYPSAYGKYAFFATHRYKTTNNLARLYEAKSGRLMFEFEVPAVNVVATFAPDEKTIAIARPHLRVWQVRDCATGKVLRTLPLVPEAGAGAFSPDNATLYSVANGVLYRQRAR